jgi:hypothetical protein
MSTQLARHGGTAARRHGGTAARRHGGTAARRHVDERRFHRAAASACLLAVCAITAMHRIGISVFRHRSARIDRQRLSAGMKSPRRCRARRLPAGFLATPSLQEMTFSFHL